MAKEYRSEITFIEKGEKVYEKSLRVNHPIKFRGITFYQASYGSIPGDSADIRITHKDDGSFTVNRMQKGVRFPLPRGEGEFILAEIRDNFMRMGPAVSILIRPANEEENRYGSSGIMTKSGNRSPRCSRTIPGSSSIFEPLVFSLNEIDKKNYTAFSKQRPGIFLVYADSFR
jgi:cytochrome c biogenesis protein